MANQEHLEILKQGVEVWNTWRQENPMISIDLSEADLSEIDLGINFATISSYSINLSNANLSNATLINAKLSGADLSSSNLNKANLRGADLHGANIINGSLSKANLEQANLGRADLNNADLSEADLSKAYLKQANLNQANLSHANLQDAYLFKAHLREAILSGANFYGATLARANLTGATLHRACLDVANLNGALLCGADFSDATFICASLVEADLTKATLTNCSIFGISAWGTRLENTEQSNLIITRPPKPIITVDNLKVAQFIYLLLHNEEIQDVITTITSKVVLILGRFTDKRKPVLDALRDELRNYNYSPVVFDFDPSAKRDLTETVSILAHISRFVIADLTDAKSIPQELQAIIPNLPSVPIQPILHVDTTEYAMFEHYERYPWVLPIYHYQDTSGLLASIKEHILTPIEQNEREKDKIKALAEENRKLREEINKLKSGK